MQKLRNKIQEKKAELKLDNAELGLAIGRGERYIDRLLRDTVSTAKQEEIIGLLDELSFAALAKKYRDSVYIGQHNHDCAHNYLNQLHASTKELSSLQDRHESTKHELRKLTISAGGMAEQFDRSAKQLAASVAQNENLKEQVKNMAMQLTNVELDSKELQGDLDSAKFNLNAEKISNLREYEESSQKIQELESDLDQKGGALCFMKIICIVLAMICVVIIYTAAVGRY